MIRTMIAPRACGPLAPAGVAPLSRPRETTRARTRRSAAPVWGHGPPSRREQAARASPAGRPHKPDARRTGAAAAVAGHRLGAVTAVAAQPRWARANFWDGFHRRQGPSCPAGRGKIAGPGPRTGAPSRPVGWGGRNSERRAPAGERLSGRGETGWMARTQGGREPQRGWMPVRSTGEDSRPTEDNARRPYRPAPLRSRQALHPSTRATRPPAARTPIRDRARANFEPSYGPRRAYPLPEPSRSQTWRAAYTPPARRSLRARRRSTSSPTTLPTSTPLATRARPSSMKLSTPPAPTPSRVPWTRPSTNSASSPGRN